MSIQKLFKLISERCLSRLAKNLLGHSAMVAIRQHCFDLAINYSSNQICISRELEVLTRRQLLKVASLNMSGKQLLNASQALFKPDQI